MAATLVDRLVQHCPILKIRGNSNPLRENLSLALLPQQDGALAAKPLLRSTRRTDGPPYPIST
jgi:hypothetical protein